MSLEAPVIRPARAEDLERVGEVIEAAYTGYVARIGFRPMPMGEDHARQIAEGAVHVIDADPIPGLVVLAVEDGEFVLHNVAVAPGEQGRGLGRALIAFAEQEGRRRGFDEVILYTHELMTENRALYGSLGYREIDHPDELNAPRVFMAKALD